MFLIVGLGNPGKKYEKTRHHAGFLALDELCRSEGLPDFKEKFSGVWTRGKVFGGPEVVALKPLTFMNLSGDSVQPASTFLKAVPAEIIVLHDELDLPFGQVRLKSGGGHGGHNGLRSIIERLGTPDFVRVRMGIGRPPPGFRGDVADYVLEGFDASERAELPDLVSRALRAVKLVVTDGLAAAMNAVNQSAPPRNQAKANR